MKKIIIMELILAFSIFYLIKYVPNYENTILVLRNDIKIEREEPLERSEEDLFLLKKNIYVKEISNLNDIWVGKTYSYDELKEMSLFFRWLINEGMVDREEYNKETGYFIIEPNKEFYALSENEEIMNAEFNIFLLVKVILLYLVPMLLTFLLLMIGTALMTICYFIIFIFSLLYCFYCFIKIEDNKLNTTYYISIYLLQYLLFIFLVIYL